MKFINTEALYTQVNRLEWNWLGKAFTQVTFELVHN